MGHNAETIKLASIAVHAEELIESYKLGDGNAVTFDIQAIEGLLSDPGIVACLDELRADALLPLKRSE